MKKSLLSIKLCWVKDETNVIILQFQYLFCINFTLQNLLIYTHNKNFDVGFGIYLITAWMFALVYIYSKWLMSAWSVCREASSGLESFTSHPYTRNYSSASTVKTNKLEGLLWENHRYHNWKQILALAGAERVVGKKLSLFLCNLNAYSIFSLDFSITPGSKELGVKTFNNECHDHQIIMSWCLDNWYPLQSNLCFLAEILISNPTWRKSGSQDSEWALFSSVPML